MSIKQMYVKNEDLEIYAKAEKYGTSFANVVVEALREYVKQQERNRDTEGYSPILLEVGRYHPLPTRTSLKSFWGKQIANYEEDQDDPRQGEGFHIKAGVYLTKKGKYIIWIRRLDCECIEIDEDEICQVMSKDRAMIQIFDELPVIPTDLGSQRFFSANDLWIPTELIIQAQHWLLDNNNIGDGVEELDV